MKIQRLRFRFADPEDVGLYLDWANDSLVRSNSFNQEAIKYEQQFATENITRPAHWGGYCLQPQLIEFWQGRPSRLHDRIQYTKINDSWKIERLAP